MARWVEIADVKDISENEVRRFDIDDLQIAICRVNGQFFAFDEICSHQYASLAEGHLEGHTIECPMHGAQFDVRTGEALMLPATEKIHTYPVQTKDKKIYIQLED